MTNPAPQSAQILEWTAPTSEQSTAAPEPLRESVHRAVCAYLDQLDGHEPSGLYELVMNEVEQPLLAAVFHRTGGNQTRTATILGMSRSTLRKKLAQYGLA